MENNQIVIYQTADGETSIDVTIDQETIWLTQSQIVDLFQSSKANTLPINRTGLKDKFGGSIQCVGITLSQR